MRKLLGLVTVLCCMSSIVNAVEYTRLAPLLEEQSKGDKRYGAQVLYSIRETTVFDNLNWETVQYYSIYINDQEAARDYGRIAIRFNHYYSNLKLDFANVKNKKGEVKALAKDALQQGIVSEQDFYTESSEVTFSLPEVVPGSTIEFQFRRSSKVKPLSTLFSEGSRNYWFQPKVGGKGWRADPIKTAIYTIHNGSEVKLYKQMFGPSKTKVNYKYDESGIDKKHQWKWRKLPPIIPESFMPPIKDFAAEVRVSTTKDWSEVDTWAWSLVKDKLHPSKKLKNEAKKIMTSKNMTHEDKIRAVYQYLQDNIRYVYAHLGRGGYEPHFPTEIIQQKYGDCKDQTTLGVALLRELGIDAYPALIVTSRNGNPDMNLVSLVFDHMIIWVPSADGLSKDMWLDTTSDKGLFPGISTYLNEQPVLIVNGKGGKLDRISAEDLPPNEATLVLNFVEQSKTRLEVEGTIHLSGKFEEDIRSWWIRDNNREDNLIQLVKNIFPQSGVDTSIKAELLNSDSLWEGVKIKAKFKFPKLDDEQQIVHATSVAQIYRMFGGFSYLPQPKGRIHPFVFPTTYKLGITARLEGVRNSFPLVLRSGSDRSTPYFTLTQLGKTQGSQYNIEITFVQKPMTLKKKEYKAYYDAISHLGEENDWLLTFNHNKQDKAFAKLKADKEGGGGVEAQINLTKYYLEQGKFEDALKLAETITKEFESNGEAWYLLGTAQGFSALFDHAEKSFERAISLGYQP